MKARADFRNFCSRYYFRCCWFRRPHCGDRRSPPLLRPAVQSICIRTLSRIRARSPGLRLRLPQFRTTYAKFSRPVPTGAAKAFVMPAATLDGTKTGRAMFLVPTKDAQHPDVVLEHQTTSSAYFFLARPGRKSEQHRVFGSGKALVSHRQLNSPNPSLTATKKIGTTGHRSSAPRSRNARKLPRGEAGAIMAFPEVRNAIRGVERGPYGNAGCLD